MVFLESFYFYLLKIYQNPFLKQKKSAFFVNLSQNCRFLTFFQICFLTPASLLIKDMVSNHRSLYGSRISSEIQCIGGNPAA